MQFMHNYLSDGIYVLIMGTKKRHSFQCSNTESLRELKRQFSTAKDGYMNFLKGRPLSSFLVPVLFVNVNPC